jgi:hypothetical protein
MGRGMYRLPGAFWRGLVGTKKVAAEAATEHPWTWSMDQGFQSESESRHWLLRVVGSAFI